MIEATVLVLPPAFFAFANLVDKFLVDEHADEKGVDVGAAAFTFLSGIFNLVGALGLLMYVAATSNVVCDRNAIALCANGATYVAAMFLYLRCLYLEEATRVVPWMQTIPIFGVVGSVFFLNKTPQPEETAAMALIIVGAWSLTSGRGGVSKVVAPCMLACSGLFALNDVIFVSFKGDNHNSAIAFDLLGKAFFCIVLGAHSRVRAVALGRLRHRFGLLALQEVATITGDAVTDIAKFRFNVFAIEAMCCVQPLFVLLGGVGLVWWRPDMLKEEIEASSVRKKAFSVLLVIGGGVLLTKST